MIEADVLEALRGVADPEIPAVSIVDLGIVDEVEITDSRVIVKCLPTFVGCPALEVIKEDIEKAIEALGARPEVRYVFDPPWTTERITAEGRKKLNDYGLAPPGLTRARSGSVGVLLLSAAKCPYCGSANTVLESPFGPTLCRATCYCRSCRNPFEQLKPV